MSAASEAHQLDEMITAYWLSQAIYAAAKFQVADHLKDGPRTIEDLATACGAHPESLYRLLRALASRGIFSEIEPQRFQNTPLSEPLCSDAPESKRALALMSGDEQFRTWAEIDHTIRTGEIAFDKVYGQPIFEYLGQHPEKAKIFDAAMVGIHGRESDVICAAYDFSGIQKLADIGGGNGSQLSHILQRYPALQGVLFDLPHVIERAQERVRAAGLADRCELIGGNFFEAVPEGADLYLMRHIIHDWDDDKSRLILRNCHRAMAPGGKLLLVESVIPSGNEPHHGKFLDLVMMLIPGGKERTECQYRELFQSAGFELTRVIPTSGEVSVIEARKVGS